MGPPPGGGKVHLEGEVPPPGARPISLDGALWPGHGRAPVTHRRGRRPPRPGAVGAACGRQGRRVSSPKGGPAKRSFVGRGRTNGTERMSPARGTERSAIRSDDGILPEAASRRGQGPFLFLREKKKRALTPKKKSHITGPCWSKTAAGGFTPCWVLRPRPLRPPVVEQGRAVVLSGGRLALRRADGSCLVRAPAAVVGGFGWMLLLG